jgi:23S rRNA pseudouridine1911/1915/1917 synthase
MDIQTIFADSDILVLNKPPGVVVNPAESVKEETVFDWIKSGQEWFMPYRDLTDEFSLRAGIAHRIDKETSGILLVAKNPAAFVELQRQFKEREITKTYLAIAHGKLVPSKGQINAPVGRLPWNKEQFGVIPGGKESVTEYEVIKHLKFADAGTVEIFSLVKLFPKSGRTHQIRVHLKYLGFPILGDYLYAGRKVSRDDRNWAPRVMLHAHEIVFTHPATRNQVKFNAPVPPDMQTILDSAEEIIS